MTRIENINTEGFSKFHVTNFFYHLSSINTNAQLCTRLECFPSLLNPTDCSEICLKAET